MTKNILDFWNELIWVAAGAAILFIFGLTVSLHHRIKKLPGRSGHRKEGYFKEHESIRADGYIDSFGKVIEEAGGGLPLVVKVFFIIIPVWWVLYLIFNWTQ